MHNRTETAVSFVNIRGETLYVPACSTETFEWNGAWANTAPADPIPSALEIRLDPAPPADSNAQFVAVVTPDRVVLTDPAGSLPACRGEPPVSLVLLVYNETQAAVSFESGGVVHYIDACGSWRYEWIEGRWANRLTSEIPNPEAVRVQVTVTPPPRARVDAMFVVVTEDGPRVVESDPRPLPSCAPPASTR